MPELSRVFIIIGAILILIGILFALFTHTPKWLSWLGHLPGDIRIERDNFRFYFPITTCLLLSALLTLIFWLITRR